MPIFKITSVDKQVKGGIVALENCDKNSKDVVRFILRYKDHTNLDALELIMRSNNNQLVFDFKIQQL